MLVYPDGGRQSAGFVNLIGAQAGCGPDLLFSCNTFVLQAGGARTMAVHDKTLLASSA